MSSNEPVRVEQCDRYLAADLLDRAGKSRPAALIRGGGLSDHPLLQRIAQHRHLGWAEGHRAASEELARHRTLSQADGRREGWQPIAEADRSVPLIVGCWVHTDDEPSWWSAWAVFPGDPLGEDRTWGDEPTHAMPLPAAPALAEVHQEKRDG